MPLPADLDRIPYARAAAIGLFVVALLSAIAILLVIFLAAPPGAAAQEPATEPVTDEFRILVSNVDARAVDDDTLNRYLNGTAQVFRTGPQRGIRLHSIDVMFGASRDKEYITLNAAVHAVNDDGSRGARLTGLSFNKENNKKNDAMNRFWARENIELEPSTAYMLVLECVAGCANDNFLHISTVSDDAEDEGSAEGWSIDNGRILPSDNWTPKPRSQSLIISVQATLGHPWVVEDGFEIISSPVIGDVYGNRELIRVGVTFTDPVTVNDDAGTPTLKFGLGDPDNPARTERMRYASGSGTDTLVFEYRVLPDDQDANGIYIHADSLQINGGTINRAGYELAALLRHPTPTGYGRARIDSSIERPLAKLTDLDLSNIVLQPDFSPDLINYAANVASNITATTVTATPMLDADVIITPADSSVLLPGHQVALEEGNNVIEILVTKPGHIDVPYTVEIRREQLVIPKITRVRVISRPLNQNTNVYGNDEPVEFEFTFDHPVVVDLSLGRPTLSVDIWLNDSPQNPADFRYARGSGTNALVFQLLNDEAGLLETAIGFGLSANSISAPEGSITHATGGGHAILNHSALHRIPNQYLDNRRNRSLATLSEVHLTNVTLDQRFRSRKTLYTATPDHGATVTTVSATPKTDVSYTISPADADATVDGHQVELHDGTNEIILTATKEGAATMTYTIAVIVLTTPRVETIAIVSETPDNDTYVVGDEIKIAVTFDHPVLVDTTNGTPIIRVRFGSDEQPVDYSETTDDRRTIIFSHTVDHSRRDNDGISIPENPMNANGGIIRYLYSNTNAALKHSGIPDQPQHRVNPDPMIVENGVQITSSPAEGDTYGPAETITFTVEFDTPVTVNNNEGTPYLKFTVGNDARRADYTSISADNRTLTFAYTVAIGDEDDDGISMSANALILDGGAITGNVNANDADLEHPAPGTSGLFSGHKVDATTTAPVITALAISSDPGSDGTYATGDTVTVAVTYNQGVEIDTTDGTPSLAVTIGDDARAASYAGINSAKTVLTFSYTVVSEDSDQDGVSIAANSLTLNSGSITADEDSADALLIHVALPTQAGHLVNKIPLIVTDGVQITSTPASGDTYQAGETITFTVTLDSDVAVDTTDGTPSLAVTLGNANRQAAYTGIDATKRILTFAYTVATDDLDEDGLSVPANAIALNNGTITHTTTGKDADLSHEPPGTSGSFPNHRADGSPVTPAIAADGITISSTPIAETDTYGLGETIVVSMAFTAPVVVDTTDGTPSLSVRIGNADARSRDREAKYQRGSGSSTLQFEWKVLANDRDNNGIRILADSLELNGGTIRNTTNLTDALLTHPLPGGNGIFADHKVDGRLLPALASLSALSFSRATLSPTFEPATISYTATFPADAASTTVTATAESGTTITIAPADSDTETDGHQVDLTEAPDEITVTVSKADSADRVYRVNIALTSAIITDLATITDLAIISDPGSDGAYATGDAITVAVTYDQAVDVDTTDGTPSLAVTIGDNARSASYAGHNEAKTTIAFSYTVVSEDSDQDGISIAANSLTLNNGAITADDDDADASLDHAALLTQTGHLVNKIPLIITNGVQITSNPASGDTYQSGETITFTVTFDSDVIVDTTDGTPSLALTVGTTPKSAAYTAINVTNRILTFSYTVASGDLDEDGLSVPANAIAPNSGTITHTTTGKDADLDHPLPGTNGLFPGHKVNAVAVAPAIADGGVTITSTPLAAADTYGRNEIIIISVAFTSPVVVNTADGTPTMTFKVGNAGLRAATRKTEYQRGSGSSTLQFEWRVSQGSRDNNGIRIRANALQLNGGTIRDAATGIDALLTHPDPVSEITFGNHKLDGRLLADFTNLSDLSLSGGTLAPNFGTTVLRYTATFPADATSTTVTATAPSDHTVTIQPADSDTEATGHQVDLTQEPEEVVVTVTTATAATYTYRVKIVVSSPEITALAFTSDPGADGTYATGDVITLAATYNVPVTVDTTDGTPSLALTIGDNARDAGYTETGALGRKITFSYTVVSDDSDQDGIAIAADSLALNNGTIRKRADTVDASPTHAALDTQTGHVVNKIPLIVAGGVQITSSPASGDTYELGETITFTVTFDSDVVVDATDGTPYLAVVLGNADRQAAYTAIDATNRILTFSYTVASDDLDEDGLSVPANALALGGGTIKHTTTGKDADLSHAIPGMSGDFPNHRADGIPDAPAITGVTLTSDAGPDNTYATGDTITVAVTYDEAVAVDTTGGTPSLTLTVGNNSRSAGYTTIDSAETTLTFSYTVVSDDGDQDGISIAADSLALNNGTIRNKADTADASLSHSALSMQSDHLVNKIPLIVTGGVQITSNPASGDTYLVGETITFTATLDAAVAVNTTGGTPTLAFTIGATARSAAYNSISSDSKTLGFSYTVVAGDLDTDGVSVAANALSLNSGTIKHSSTGKDADLSHPLPGTSGVFTGHKIDAIPDPPTITSVTLTSNAGTDNTYATYDAITAAVTYSEAIAVDTTDGTPSLALTIGDNARSAGFTSIDSSETVLTFSYTVISDDSDQDGISIAANSLALNAGTIRNKADTVDASLTHAALATQTGHLVNKIPLIITDGVDITSSPASGNPYAPGEAITFGVTFDSDVTVDTTDGTPTLALTIGTAAKTATYTTIDATNRILTFSYTIASRDQDTDGVSVAANALALNNGAIKHFTTGRDADLSHPLPGTNGVFPQHQVGRQDITDLSISSDPGIHATYATGDTITVAVTFAELVTVDTTGGTPYLPLTIGSRTRNAAYTSTDSSGLILTFSYTIVAEDRDNNGPSIAANSLTLDGGTIRYAGTTNDVSLTHPALPNQTGHRVNRAPAIVNDGVDVTSSPLGDETYGLNETITISVTFNSVVVVDTTNGTPRVDVLFAAYHNDDDDRARFRYARGSGTRTLEFDYTVQSGDRDSNGIFISLNQLSLDGGTITHITTGRNANLRHDPAGDSGTLAGHKVDGSTINIPRPRISSVAFGSDPSRLQTYITGSTINVIVTFDEEVDIDETNGTPHIALTIGDAVRNAAYVGSVSGTIDMHFNYTVVAEDSDQDGVSIAANAISLNGATIRNSDDTVDASLDHAALPDNPDHVVNKIPLIVTGGVQIASTPSSDDTYGRNEIITFIVGFDSDVTVDVIDGAPYLEFTIGDNLRTAAYDASSSSDRSLVFSYTVVQADSDDDGVSMAANAVNLDGASITHSQIGTDADLTHPAPGIFAGHEVDGSTIAATRPVITGLAISSDPGDDRTYAAGDVITATVTFDQPVTVTFETPSGELWLPLTIGESQREAHYSSTDSSGHVLTFSYTVVEQDRDPDGVSIPRNSISGQSVRVDLSGQTFHANLFHLELDDQPDHRVNAAPRIIDRGVRITSSPRSGDTYRIGETISFSVTFDSDVVVDTTNGRPYMRLRVDESPGADNAPYLRYSSGSGSQTLHFSWTIPQRTRDHSGIYMPANQLHAGRSTIRHASTGRDAILEHERPGRLDGDFPDHKILPRHYRYIDKLALASDAGDDRTYRTGDVITATVRFNDYVDLNTAGGSPFFRLIIGDTLRLAQYSAEDSTRDTLHFHYTVVAEDRDDDGVYMRSNGLQLNGSVITAAGETDEAFVKHPWVEDQHNHRVNTP